MKAEKFFKENCEGWFFPSHQEIYRLMELYAESRAKEVAIEFASQAPLLLTKAELNTSMEQVFEKWDSEYSAARGDEKPIKTTMNKAEVQSRILQNGKPLALKKFTWDKKAKALSTTENSLVIDFWGINGCTFKTGSGCTFKTGSGCTFTTGFGCTFTTGFGCTFTTGSGCTFTTGSGCTFKTGFGCTFTTGSGCTFKTGSGCTFTTGSGCTFTTGSGCTFMTGSGCTFTTGSRCVIVRSDIFEIIPSDNDEIILCPCRIEGYLKKIDGKYYFRGDTGKGEHIISDGILSKVLSKRAHNGFMIYKVINHGEKEESYLIQQGELSAHGKSVSECRESIIYKISDRDTGEYDGMTLDTVLSYTDQIRMYRKIAGSCESATRAFAETQEKKDRTIREVISVTKGQYGNDVLKKFFNTNK